MRAGLVKAALTDRKFPIDGNAEAAKARLRECMADGEMLETVYDAETDWLSY